MVNLENIVFWILAIEKRVVAWNFKWVVRRYKQLLLLLEGVA